MRKESEPVMRRKSRMATTTQMSSQLDPLLLVIPCRNTVWTKVVRGAKKLSKLTNNNMKTLLVCPHCGADQKKLLPSGVEYKCGTVYHVLGDKAKTTTQKCSATNDAVVKGEI